MIGLRHHRILGRQQKGGPPPYGLARQVLLFECGAGSDGGLPWQLFAGKHNLTWEEKALTLERGL
jgi:hypothetical protein